MLIKSYYNEIKKIFYANIVYSNCYILKKTSINVYEMLQTCKYYNTHSTGRRHISTVQQFVPRHDILLSFCSLQTMFLLIIRLWLPLTKNNFNFPVYVRLRTSRWRVYLFSLTDVTRAVSGRSMFANEPVTLTSLTSGFLVKIYIKR